MSEREVWLVEVLNQVQFGSQTVAAAASVLGGSERQARQLFAFFQHSGGFGMVHNAPLRHWNRS